MNHVERIKEKWSRGELCVAATVALTDPAVTEIYGEAGYDIIWVDCEHSALTVAEALNHVRAARGAGAAAFIRVPSNDPVVVKPYLELHPAAIIVPRISSVEDAQQAVSSCRYPPRGVRGFGPARGSKFGDIGAADYLATVDDEIMVVLQIEHIDAVNRIEAILDVQGIDCVITGPGDLSATMGHAGQGGHPDVSAAVESVYRAARARGIPTGHSMGSDPEALRHWLAKGLSWVAVDNDWGTLYRSAKRIVNDVREIAQTVG